jgi:hypothetical protein
LQLWFATLLVGLGVVESRLGNIAANMYECAKTAGARLAGRQHHGMQPGTELT